MEHGDGTFGKYEPHQVIIMGDDLVMIPMWKAEVEELVRKRDEVEKSLRALDTMLQQGRISEATYEDLRKEYEAEYVKVEEAIRGVEEKLQARVRELQEKAREVEKFLAKVEIQHTIGAIPADVYREQSEALRATLARTVAEIKDLQSILSMLEARKAA